MKHNDLFQPFFFLLHVASFNSIVLDFFVNHALKNQYRPYLIGYRRCNPRPERQGQGLPDPGGWVSARPSLGGFRNKPTQAKLQNTEAKAIAESSRQRVFVCLVHLYMGAAHFSAVYFFALFIYFWSHKLHRKI